MLVINSPFFWALLNLVSILVLAFFSMQEMAFVSFNKVRLQFYVSQKLKRALWLNHLLQNSSQLFATTLLGVNLATFIGAECARRFFEAVGINADLAPFIQVFLVVIFGELAPMFAARRYAEHVALIGVPVIYFSSIILKPLIWFLSLISKVVNYLLGGAENYPHLFLSQEELQKVLETQDEERNFEGNDFNATVTNIFSLRSKIAKQVMTALHLEIAFASHTKVKEIKKLITQETNYLLIFHQTLKNIIGIVFIKDLLKALDYRPIRDYCKPPWFISQTTPLIQILKQFRRNSENIAIVLDDKGQASGFLSFEDILGEIFGKNSLNSLLAVKNPVTFIERTLPGEITLAELKKILEIELEGELEETLSDYLLKSLEHPPEIGEIITLPPFELVIKETTLLGIKTVAIKTHLN